MVYRYMGGGGVVPRVYKKFNISPFGYVHLFLLQTLLSKKILRIAMMTGINAKDDK